MYTSVGELLQARRREGRYDLEQIFSETKVPRSVLGWIEESNYRAIGSRLYFMRYVKAYADFLSIDYSTISSDCEREWELYTFREARKEKKLVTSHVSQLSLRYGFLASIALVVVLIAAYFSYQLRFLVGAPGLKINLPSTVESLVQNQFIDINGQSFNDAKITINQRPIAVTGENFTERLYLVPGLNTISVTATNLRGKVTHQVRYVVYKP